MMLLPRIMVAITMLVLAVSPAISSGRALIPLPSLVCPEHSIGHLYVGSDISTPKPGLGIFPQPETLTATGPVGPRTIWWCFSLYGMFSDATYSANAIAGQPTGLKGGAIVFRAPSLTTGRAFAFTFYEGKGTDAAELWVVDVATGALVANLKKVYLTLDCQEKPTCGIDAYGGTYPPANCGYRPDGGSHMYCQWFQGEVSIATLADGRVRIVGKVYTYGSGPKGDPSRAVPFGTKMQVGPDLVWQGALPPGVGTTGYAGLGAEGFQAGLLQGVGGLVSLKDFTISDVPDQNLPPVCE